MSLMLSPLTGIPLIKPGDDLASIALDGLANSNIQLENQDILVFAQKIISKSENRYRQISRQVISSAAMELAEKIGKEAGLVELILSESKAIIRAQEGLLIVEHNLGFICANAGIDQSNISKGEDWALLLPKDPSKSAFAIRTKLETKTGKKIAVLVIDSHGRPWRNGTLGLAIGMSGLPPIVDFRGKADLDGRLLKVTTVAVADELAAAASLVMGPADEGRPIVHVRGFPYNLSDGKLAELLREKGRDVFR